MTENVWIFSPKICAMIWNECDINFHILAILSFWDMVNFVLKILSELGILTIASVIICESDSETLTSDTR